VPIDGKTLYVARVQSRRNALVCLFACIAVGALIAFQESADTAGSFVDELGFGVFLAMLALAFAARSPLGLTARLGLGPSRFSWGVLALAVFGTLGLSFALDGIYRIFEPQESSMISQFEAELAGVRGRALAFAMLSFALAPGVAEELLCRGWLQRGLEIRYGAATAILLASLFFGALHLDPIYSFFAAALGLYLGSIAYLAGSVRPAIACHVANNAVAVIGVALLPEFGSTAMPWIAFAGAASLGVLGGLWRHLGRPPNSADSARQRGAELQRRDGSDDS
jgi:membrane protease YdiL (CAAX protease family)